MFAASILQSKYVSEFIRIVSQSADRYRSVLAEVLTKFLGHRHVNQVFPNLHPEAVGLVGLDVFGVRIPAGAPMAGGGKQKQKAGAVGSQRIL